MNDSTRHQRDNNTWFGSVYQIDTLSFVILGSTGAFFNLFKYELRLPVGECDVAVLHIEHIVNSDIVHTAEHDFAG